MQLRVVRAWWPLLSGLLLVLLLGESGRLPAPEAAAQDACPPGTVALPFVSLAEVYLREGAPPYTRMLLSRITIEPGASLDVVPTGFTAYYVESGVLKMTYQPWMSMTWQPACAPADGHYAMSGSTQIDANAMLTVSQGETLILEDVPASAIINGGNEPLVVLEMTVMLPEIDPASGLPLVDPVMAAREAAYAREEQKRACRAAARAETMGTPAAWDILAVARATPAVSTAGWESDGPARPPRVPRACRSQEVGREPSVSSSNSQS